MANKQYLDYDGLKEVLTKLKEKFASIDAITFKDAVANVAALPALSVAKAGWMYTITSEDTTTADFVEGTGKVIDAFSEVVCVNKGTESVPELKWFVMGNVFSLKDKVSFGEELPVAPFNKQVFCYTGENTYKYTAATPSGTENPAAYSWYEKVGENYTPSTDVSVDPGKTYYEREDDKIKGIIYVYDSAESKWISGATGGDTDMVPITDTEIDSLFDELWPIA